MIKGFIEVTKYKPKIKYLININSIQCIMGSAIYFISSGASDWLECCESNEEIKQKIAEAQKK